MTDLREQYARIIDPKAWVPVIFSGDPDWHPDDQRLEQNRSLAKADAILALLPQPAVPDDLTDLFDQAEFLAGQDDEPDAEAALGRSFMQHRRALLALIGKQPAVPEGFVLVPREPDEDLIRAMNDGYRSVRRQGVSGMSIDAQWRAEYGPEIAAYRALLAAIALAEQEMETDR